MAEVIDELCGVIHGQNNVIDRQNDVIRMLYQLLATHLAADEYEALMREVETVKGDGDNG